MKLTKYEHACFTIEKDGQVLVVDPGGLTSDFIPTENIIAVIVTHEHSDHFDPDTLAAIYSKSPKSILIAIESIIQKMPDHASRSVQPGERIKVGAFDLEFFGGKHAKHHDSIPVVDNIGVFVDQQIYYPGDSFVIPNKSVNVLALPISAPWLKIGETIDFLNTIKPKLAFPTHDAILSESGKAIPDRLLPTFAEKLGTTYQRLDGKTIEI